jgi:shikimate kinase
MLGFEYVNFSAVYRLPQVLSTTPHARRTMTDDAAPPLDRPLVLIGLMGAGKSHVGRRLADRLGVPFVDADGEIEAAAGCTIEEIFERFGEAAFRDGERRVMARLIDGPPRVIAAGGGAYMDPETRARISAKALALWLRADLDTLVRRTSGRGGRPLLKDGDPGDTLKCLIEQRYPIYGEADIIIDTGAETAEETAARAADAVRTFMTRRGVGGS